MKRTIVMNVPSATRNMCATLSTNEKGVQFMEQYIGNDFHGDSFLLLGSVNDKDVWMRTGYLKDSSLDHCNELLKELGIDLHLFGKQHEYLVIVAQEARLMWSSFRGAMTATQYRHYVRALEALSHKEIEVRKVFAATNGNTDEVAQACIDILKRLVRQGPNDQGFDAESYVQGDDGQYSPWHHAAIMRLVRVYQDEF